MKRGQSKKTKNQKERGQATIEFALTLMILLAFTFFYFQTAFTFAFGNLAHYATFMAARAYLAAGMDEKDQRQRAQETLERLIKRGIGQGGVDRWPGVARGSGAGGELRGAAIGAGSQFDSKDPGLAWQQGVRYTFKSRIFLLPMGNGKTGNDIELTSESWLGREKSYDECRDYIEKRAGKVIIDNGC